VNWGGFVTMAKEKKFRFLAMVCLENIKALATAIEVYGRDHKGKFPEKLKKLIPKYIRTMPVCPICHKFYEYKLEGEDYYIRCPGVKEHQMTELMFSSKRGWVTK